MIKVQLVVVQGRPEGKTIPLTGPVFRIGRDETCQLRPSSDEVSRRHAEIVITADSATVKDLGSRNGTFLNSKPVTEPTILKSGDLIKVGPLTFAVSIQGAPVPAGAVAGKANGGAAASLDEVSDQEVESWLIADTNHPVPDRPSGVYDGDTVMMDTYQGSKKTAAAAPAAPAPKPLDPAIAAASPPPAPAPTEAPKAPVADPPKPAPVGPRVLTAPPKSIYEEIENIEYLPEGEGDSEPSSYSDPSDSDSDSAGEAAADEMPEEWIDESNPFYIAKKKAQEAAKEEAAKPVFKDSSEAANAILKKMMDRRRGGG